MVISLPVPYYLHTHENASQRLYFIHNFYYRTQNKSNDLHTPLHVLHVLHTRTRKHSRGHTGEGVQAGTRMSTGADQAPPPLPLPPFCTLPPTLYTHPHFLCNKKCKVILLSPTPICYNVKKGVPPTNCF